MGAKTFINTTTYNLSVMLTVRSGATPGIDESTPDSFSLAPGKSQWVQYSGDEHPYLDGIAVNAIDHGNMVASQDFVVTRGSQVDNDLNTHDTVLFCMQNASIVLGFSNT